jgi:hypothetical protein
MFRNKTTMSIVKPPFFPGKSGQNHHFS